MTLVNGYVRIGIIFEDLFNGRDSCMGAADNNYFFFRDVAILSGCRILRVYNE